jgi:hypothetical protein
MLATIRDELRSRVGRQGGWRHDQDGVNSGLDSPGRGVLHHLADPVGTSDPGGGVLEVAMMLLLFVVILIGSYWFVMVPSGRNGRRENPTGTEDDGGTREP